MHGYQAIVSFLPQLTAEDKELCAEGFYFSAFLFYSALWGGHVDVAWMMVFPARMYPLLVSAQTFSSALMDLGQMLLHVVTHNIGFSYILDLGLSPYCFICWYVTQSWPNAPSSSDSSYAHSMDLYTGLVGILHLSVFVIMRHSCTPFIIVNITQDFTLFISYAKPQ